jgi:hypothetical protein
MVGPPIFARAHFECSRVGCCRLLLRDILRIADFDRVLAVGDLLATLARHGAHIRKAEGLERVQAHLTLPATGCET